MEPVMVSVVCLVYNHEKYLRKTLDGFVSQKTNFKYEIIVHDDASTDNSAEIIREYSTRYPDLIIPICQTENQFSKRIGIHKHYTIPIIKSKYVALCEGDDFWTSGDKLQSQFEIMENNPSIAMCVHTVQGVDESGKPLDRMYPNPNVFSPGIIQTQELLDAFSLYQFQTSSYFMKADLWKEMHLNPPQFRKSAGVGDEPMMLYMSVHGGIYYIPNVFSCYRQMSESSWSKEMSSSVEKRRKYNEKRYNMMKEFDKYTDNQFNCHLSLYEGRYLLYSEQYKELWKKRKDEYFQKLSKKKQFAIRLCSCFPFLGCFIRDRI